MPEKKIHLKIITPEAVKVDQEADMVIMRCTTGDMGVLPGHEPRSAVLNIGAFRIINGRIERRIAVYGGLATIQNDVLTVLTRGADWPEEISLDQAKIDREHFERRVREKIDDIEIQNDEILLRRALVQIEVSEYTIDE